MSSRLLASFRSLSLNVPRQSFVRSLATVSDPPKGSTSGGESRDESTITEYKWQTRPPRKPTAKERATPGRVHLDAKTPLGFLRPHLAVEVNPNHGLYGFFRKTQDDVTGVPYYETLEAMDKVDDYSGRAWLASELRRKSFKDLHTLWYVLARERNLLATQAQEAHRLGFDIKLFSNTFRRDMRCRKSMARIKQVLNERRLAYDQAVHLHKCGVTGEQIEAADAKAAARAEAEKARQAAAKGGMLEDMGESRVRPHP
ncbi:Ribosomal protein subunit L4 [Ceratobasidium theobromae]|uniref:Large ribosomal subunit protein uL29m n=1 Tax=Ceratobasidium theobromae TaxID=1582974 RepID=A0A5N5QC02_9AGAM|nr:Ribosomal protein subunit L4 [Ceratobasidium theobromae]